MTISTVVPTVVVPSDWVSFHDEATGAHILPNRFYGFGDSGFIAGDFHGYLTREEAIASIGSEFDYDTESTEDIGTIVADLGIVSVCVLSGVEYVDHVNTLEPEGYAAYGVLYTKFPFHLFKDWTKS